MNWKTAIISIFAAVAAFCTIPFINLDAGTSQNTAVVATTVVATNVVETVNVSTNAIGTNFIDRANQQNLNWFKDSSNYIWDGWKIK